MEITVRIDTLMENPKKLLQIARALELLAGESGPAKTEHPIASLVSKAAEANDPSTFTREELAADAALPPLGRMPTAAEAVDRINATFGKQPLPEGAAPLAPAASPAAVDPSTTAPAAPPASSTAVPAPPVPAAASTPAPPAATTAPADSVKRDKNGLPWDERIHASSRAMNADGTWRSKRNVQAHLVVEVEAQLRGQTHGSKELDEDALKLAALGGNPGATVAAPTPPVPAATGANVAPPAPPAGEQLTFQAVVQRIGPKMRDGTISPERFLEVVTPFGLTGLHQLNNQPHDVLAEICKKLGV